MCLVLKILKFFCSFFVLEYVVNKFQISATYFPDFNFSELLVFLFPIFRCPVNQTCRCAVFISYRYESFNNSLTCYNKKLRNEVICDNLMRLSSIMVQG